MVNRVILVGRMTRDAESATGPHTAMTRMRIATNVTWRDADGNRQERAEFHTVVAFGRLAEVTGEYCTRGRRVYVEGHLRTRDYEGSDGLRRTSTEVVAETLKLLDGRARSTEESEPETAPGDPEEPGEPAVPRPVVVGAV